MFRQVIHLFFVHRERDRREIMKNISMSLFILFLVGCESNPIPRGVSLSQQQSQERRIVEPPFSIVGKTFLDFYEGTERIYTYSVKVPDGGEPVVDIINPPEEGFRFQLDSPSNGKIIWTPSFEAADNFIDDETEDKSYISTTIRLRDKNTPFTSWEFPLVVLVRDVPREFYIESEDSLVIYEGEPFEFSFKVVNQDDPDGKHSIKMENTFIERVLGIHMMNDEKKDPSLWRIEGTLPFNLIKVGNKKSLCGNSLCSRYYWTIRAVSPKGFVASKVVKVSINDKRLPPELIIPREPKISPNGSFSFLVWDPNGEVNPIVSLYDMKNNIYVSLLEKDEEEKIVAAISRKGGEMEDFSAPSSGINWHATRPVVSASPSTLQERLEKMKREKAARRYLQDNISVNVERVSSNGVYQSLVVIQAENLPPDLMNKTLKMKFGFCNKNKGGYVGASQYDDVDEDMDRVHYTPQGQFHFKRQHCTIHDLPLLIKSEEQPFPVFKRDAWPVGETHYMKEGKMVKIDLPVFHTPEETAMIESYELHPVSNPIDDNQLIWDKGELFISPTVSGDQSFVFSATNSIGRQSISVFSLKILPYDWHTILFASNNPYSKESSFYRKLLQLSNLDILNINLYGSQGGFMESEDKLALRETLMVGSDIFEKNNKSALRKLDEFKDEIPNIVISTVFMDRLPEGLKKEMDDYGVYFRGNYKDIYSKPDLVPVNELVFDTEQRFPMQRPKGEVSLKGSFHSWSDNPAVFVLGNSDCKILLQLKHKTDTSFLRNIVAVKCPRDGEGSLVLVGFDIPDIRTPTGSSGLIVNWLHHMNLKRKEQ